jgi:hypothetical protein
LDRHRLSPGFSCKWLHPAGSNTPAGCHCDALDRDAIQP